MQIWSIKDRFLFLLLLLNRPLLPPVTSFCGLCFWPQHCAVQVWRKNWKKKKKKKRYLKLLYDKMEVNYRMPFSQTTKWFQNEGVMHGFERWCSWSLSLDSFEARRNCLRIPSFKKLQKHAYFTTNTSPHYVDGLNTQITLFAQWV